MQHCFIYQAANPQQYWGGGIARFGTNKVCTRFSRCAIRIGGIRERNIRYSELNCRIEDALSKSKGKFPELLYPSRGKGDVGSIPGLTPASHLKWTGSWGWVPYNKKKLQENYRYWVTLQVLCCLS
jgi:hypothetical protein